MQVFVLQIVASSLYLYVMNFYDFEVRILQGKAVSRYV